MNWRERMVGGTTREKRCLIAASIFSLLLLIADQVSKWLVITRFRNGESIPVISPVLNFTSVRNLGAAWSILSGHVWLLLLGGILALVGIVLYFRKLAEGCVERYFALTMLIAGIIGNSFDRAFHGAVIDFIHVHCADVWHYPVFNVADMAICGGVILYLISGFCRRSPEGDEGGKC